jgi:histidinol dehydrogenase
VRTIRYSSPGFADRLSAFCRSASASPELKRSVAGILAEVREGGDRAVVRLAARFDGARLKPRTLRVPEGEARAAVRQLTPAQRRSLRTARANILAFNRRGLARDWSMRNPDGARVGEKHDPIRRVGIYVPGGQVPLVSSALMTVTLAVAAGCPEIAVFTPVGRSGKVAPSLLAALHLAGAREIYCVGGVQAIGAMAFGTKTIPAVDKVFGPGNAFVCEAKRQVFGIVGIDSLPGPSELMVIADGTANARFAAADLLAQAEHGSGRERIVLVSTSKGVIGRIQGEIQKQVRELSRSSKIRQVLRDGFLSVQVSNAEEAAQVANAVAPEHLELLTSPKATASLLKSVTTAGAILVGNETPTALGDFTAGPSHVLPTGGAGRFFSGLRVADFQRRTSVLRYDVGSLRRAAPVVAEFSAMECLDAHGRSVSIRLD